MNKLKKDINKEAMFSKIMPSGPLSHTVAPNVKKTGNYNMFEDDRDERASAVIAQRDRIRNGDKDPEEISRQLADADKYVEQLEERKKKNPPKKKRRPKPEVKFEEPADDDEQKTDRPELKLPDPEDEDDYYGDDYEEETVAKTTETTEIPENENQEENAEEVDGEKKDEKPADEENAVTEEKDSTEEVAEKIETEVAENTEKSVTTEGEKNTVAEEKQTETPVPSAVRVVNIREKMVESKVDEALEKFNCCTCSLCRQDVICTALNSITPKYMAVTEEDVDKIIEKEDFSEITQAIMKAILHVRTNPRH